MKLDPGKKVSQLSSSLPLKAQAQRLRDWHESRQLKQHKRLVEKQSQLFQIQFRRRQSLQEQRLRNLKKQTDLNYAHQRSFEDKLLFQHAKRVLHDSQINQASQLLRETERTYQFNRTNALKKKRDWLKLKINWKEEFQDFKWLAECDHTRYLQEMGQKKGDFNSRKQSMRSSYRRYKLEKANLSAMLKSQRH